ncbi:LamG domain-containing protein [Candidatus Poribacteria bacterium]|nr:LamG domain-containing protein [Candidatus Poribacteria bacterium]
MKHIILRHILTTLLVICISTLLLNTAKSTSIFDGLISHWTFDTDHIKGKEVRDDWSKNHGIMRGNPTQTKGIIGEALSFDGIDDYIVIGEVTEGYDLTYTTWIQATNIPNNNPGVMILWDSNSEPGGDSYIGLAPSGRISVKRKPDGFGDLISQSTILPNQWTYIAFVADSQQEKNTYTSMDI